jgi:hypothetical protein
MFDKSVKHVPSLSMRGKAYAISGMAEYLKQFGGASDIKRYLTVAADSLLDQYKKHSKQGWHWFEDILSYDNAALPHALFVVATVTGEDKYLDVAKESCQFLIDSTYDGSHFSFIGCNGWYKKGKDRAQFDQQPMEVTSTVAMLRASYQATSNPEHLKLEKLAFDWFLGKNDLHMPIYDFRTKGSCDGLEETGVNLNQGAESLVSFMLSLLCIIESFSTTRKPKESKKPSIPITEINSARKEAKTNSIENKV